MPDKIKYLKKVGIQQKQQVVLLMPIMVLRYIIDPRHLIIVIIGYAVSRTSDCMNARTAWYMQLMKARWLFKDWMATS